MNAPEKIIKPLEWAPMTAAETDAFTELVTDLIYASPRTDQPVINQGDRTLRYLPDDPHCVTLTWGPNANALHVLILEAPAWIPWHAGKWCPPPETGALGEYGDCAVYRRGSTH